MTICFKAATHKRQAQTCDAHRVGGGRRLRRCGHLYATATYVWQDQEAWTSAAADGAATAKGLNGSNDADAEDVQAKREQGTDKNTDTLPLMRFAGARTFVDVKGHAQTDTLTRWRVRASTYVQRCSCALASVCKRSRESADANWSKGPWPQENSQLFRDTHGWRTGVRGCP